MGAGAGTGTGRITLILSCVGLIIGDNVCSLFFDFDFDGAAVVFLGGPTRILVGSSVVGTTVFYKLD